VKRALITGITGQDGSYLADLLLDEGYEVHGLARRVALEDPAHRLSRIAGILDRVTLHAASLESFPSLYAAIAKVQPAEVYHLASQSFVSQSFEDAFSTFRINIDGTHYILESVRLAAPGCKVYFAGSSEMFGNAPHSPQNEDTPFSPRSPYGVSKLTGFHLARNYREAYGMYVCSGILFNHESPRRGYEFLTRKVTSYAARIKLGLVRELPLGNLDARRDWGYAPDYVRAMYLMMQQPVPEDLVVATGETHSVREFCDAAFSTLGLDYRDYVTQQPQFYRPGEIHVLQGDASRAREKLGWQPSIGFEELVRKMVHHDLNVVRHEIGR
jgi:GDPmannose 4,6-dehydratase